MTQSDVAIVIVNWNGRALLADCLPSATHQDYKTTQVIVVDNGSTDDSVAWIKQHYPAITLIELDHNTGFGYAQNQGMERALSNKQIGYILTLNNDAKVAEDCVRQLVACAQRHQKNSVGSIQGLVRAWDDDTRIDATGILITRDLSAINRGADEHYDPDAVKEVEIFGPSASAALYLRDALEQVRLSTGEIFDSRYFMYYEDVDLAFRLRLLGYSSYFTPQAHIYHQHSATAKRHSPFKSFYIHRNHYFNIIKNLPGHYLLIALFLLPIRYILLMSSLIRGQGAAAQLFHQPKRHLKDRMAMIVLRSWGQVITSLPWLWRERRWIQGKKVSSTSIVATWFTRFGANWRKIIYGTTDT